MLQVLLYTQFHIQWELTKHKQKSYKKVLSILQLYNYINL